MGRSNASSMECLAAATATGAFCAISPASASAAETTSPAAPMRVTRALFRCSGGGPGGGGAPGPGRRNAVDEAHLQRLGGLDAAGGEDHVLGAADADHAREAHR